MTLQDLNRQYYELYGELYQARALLPEKQYKLTAEALLQAYSDDLELCMLRSEIATGRERFELRFRSKNWLPRRRFVFFNNAMAKRLLKTFEADLQQEFKRMDAASVPMSAETLPANKKK